MNVKPGATTQEALAEGAARLRETGSESPLLDCELLLSHVLGCSRTSLISRNIQLLSSAQEQAFGELIRRRLSHEPVAYILGLKHFYGLEFAVGPGVLIPRPETELLVDVGLQLLRQRPQPARFAEIGVGSGCVSIALLCSDPTLRADGTDVADVALSTAADNGQVHGVSARFHLYSGHLLQPMDPQGKPFDLILSNPPYIPSDDIPKLSPDVRDWEPREALDGGEDGLDVIRGIINAAPEWLSASGSLLLEVGHGQACAMPELVRRGPLRVARVYPDLAGIERVVEFTWS
ncbi:MAG: peptide chain release factor N(5)-glutamine methyltransferase [Armatimonadetes bacterium]|nr:peptide chain release factor N(5)-glutamine methyltransferase [Armatimonadota bacterium]